ncbi:hypothetical protein PFICI_12014 [Pestalotiopsis fici W106-1]|uniref:NmrA-like domain-containing protein n=1 Tax=Pestalotiopsis fici (strain W106-1 / CGMCC3.15140) TaxID=1229662 RepID=W3WTY6_PESFW|nr:uncharacterized protein PFICI_12014 [Pestalotiopsis fici W106-1]ETS76627.1 hypothetical protein PFICI_12014 [Pestalotiopsis fici W106-1]
MVKIAIAGANSQLAREVINHLATTGKHEIIALFRKDPESVPSLTGVEWVKTLFEDKSELVGLLAGVHTLLCFFPAHLDKNSEAQKRLIDTAVEAGVKRYAPSEWSAGMNLAPSLDVIPWYSGKIEIREYLKQINEKTKVLEYCLFQPGWFLDYLSHPHKTSEHASTFPTLVNFEKGTAITTQWTHDNPMAYTAVEDIARVVVRAVDLEGEWPVIGGFRGNQLSVAELIRIGESIRGKKFQVDLLETKDLQAGVLKTDNFSRITLPGVPEEQGEAWSRMATIGLLQSIERGCWDISDEWNQLLPDLKFVKAEELLKKSVPA